MITTMTTTTTEAMPKATILPLSASSTTLQTLTSTTSTTAVTDTNTDNITSNENKEQMSRLVDGLTSDPSTWSQSSLISVTQLTPSGLHFLLQTASMMKTLVKTQGGDDRLKYHVLASVFYEASTRTSCSFQTAMMRLGGQVIHVDAGSGGNTSSKKGETVSDTIKCLQCYTDVTVLRHNVTGTVTNTVLGGGLEKPVLNAGDGVGEHPTQALLDLFTIVDELQLFPQYATGAATHALPVPPVSAATPSPAPQCASPSLTVTAIGQDDALIIVLLGDLKHGRTVHSLAKLLARSQQHFLKRRLVIRYCSPNSLKMPQYIQSYVQQYATQTGSDITQEEYPSIVQAMEGANVLYVTRVQKERFDSIQEYNNVKGEYIIDAAMMAKAPSNMIVMHPLPRVDEIHKEVDQDPRAAYFRQMENGLYVRMALLALVLGKV